MESHEVLKKAINIPGVKKVASDLKLSPSLVYKWCQPKDTEDASGAENPLDRVLQIVELTGDDGPLQWLCQARGGFFVSNPDPESVPTPVLLATQKLLREFSDLLEAVSHSVSGDSKIDGAEAKRIRHEWEELKCLAEQFVHACERGVYNKVNTAGGS